MYPRPRGWVFTKAAPQEACERQKGAGAEPKLTVDAVGESRRDGRMDTGSIEGSTM